MLKVDREDLREVFSVLIVNALQALQPEGRLDVHISQSHHWSNPKIAGVQVVVADNGVGIAPEHRAKIFRQSFTTKGNNGNGLGLWMASKLIQGHGGRIRFRTSREQGRAGTAFSVFLPLEGPANHEAASVCVLPANSLVLGPARFVLAARSYRDGQHATRAACVGRRVCGSFREPVAS